MRLTQFKKIIDSCKNNLQFIDLWGGAGEPFLAPDIIKTLKPKEKKELMAQEIKKAQEVADAYHVYQQLLLANNALDFGDFETLDNECPLP